MWPDRTNCTLVRDFRKGDFAYGLNNIRQIYARALRDRIKYEHVTIDTINNQFMFKYDYDRKSVPLELLPYFHYYRNGSGYGKKTASTGVKADLDNDPWDIRRLCKSAIKYTAKNGNKIRFIIDGIDFARVIAKCKYNEHKSKYCEDNSYTASELRFIYRNWSSLKYNIVFYSFGDKVLEPWRDNAAQWAHCRKKYHAEKSPLLFKQVKQELKRQSEPRTV
ncbi:MAG: hypothetical protein GY750_20560 [Lentisphaerae bacterium]|nr:hypothetical protein [Lentisphaerota bacterium]MCP4103785.1 hypothetical protein [Lentisphaerota bacterium]